MLTPKQAPASFLLDPAGASSDYQFFVPYIIMMMFPGLDIDPLNRANHKHGVPDELLYLTFDEVLFDLKEHGKQLGLGGNVVFATPKAHWDKVEEAATATMVKAGNELWHVVLQRLPLFLPKLGQTLEIVGFVAESPTKLVAYEADKYTIGTPTSYFLDVESTGDARLTNIRHNINIGELTHD